MELNGEIEPRVSLVDQEDDVDEQVSADFSMHACPVYVAVIFF